VTLIVESLSKADDPLFANCTENDGGEGKVLLLALFEQMLGII
jgi:hypothetical protein